MVRKAGIVTYLIALALTGTLACAGAALFADRWWWADLAVHFRLQYLVIGIAGMAAAVAVRSWILAPLGLVLVALNLSPVAHYFRSAELPAYTGTPTWRIAQANVFMHNHDVASWIAWIEQEQPDVATLIEADASWIDALEPLSTSYPYRTVAVDFDQAKIIVLSRWPIRDSRPLAAGSAHTQDPVLTVERRDSSIRLAALHGTWPFSAKRAAMQRREFFLLAQAARESALPFIAIGDFNCTAFSPHFADLLQAAGLTDAATGRGWLATWPTFFAPAGIRIDQVLTRGIHVTRLRVGTGKGSDHHWVVADLQPD